MNLSTIVNSIVIRSQPAGLLLLLVLAWFARRAGKAPFGSRTITERPPAPPQRDSVFCKPWFATDASGLFKGRCHIRPLANSAQAPGFSGRFWRGGHVGLHVFFARNCWRWRVGTLCVGMLSVGRGATGPQATGPQATGLLAIKP